MEKRKLGKSDIEFAPIAFGGNVFGWTADEATSHRLLDAFVDAGFSFVDTADVYSRWAPGNKGGESETIIGTWIKKDRTKRDRIVLATKCGMGLPSKALSRQHILESVDASLKRLNTDRIDLFQSHKDDKDTPQEETLSTYAELIKAGKIRFIGASNFEAPRLAEAAKIAREKGLPQYQSLQPHYNLMERALFEGDLENECLKERIGVIPYYSLASGFLSGKYRSEADLAKSARGAGVKKYLNDKGLAVLKALDDAAKKHNANSTQVALAWLIQRKSITAPIVSATSVEQLKDLIAAPAIKLDPDSVAAIDKASAP
ncbi:Predicted oxidoreductase [Enhydrobacter aerosaccus]|uniref:Predicted oxidoreductase n=1 Tax=Enhydrobacter aerosaccus TaxID=225324 RepID=A0A1T4RIC0_9HYPH|nr:aldo/keto reductase [Enhydrobacter aerosaccus]SKA15732.1 Predicted oxidoreductase [Enhydrobacter aerosaccus]